MDDVGHIDPAVVVVGRHLDFEEIAGEVKVSHVFIRQRARERLIHLDADVGPEEIIAHGRGADIADEDFFDDRPNRLGGRLRLGGRQQHPEE